MDPFHLSSTLRAAFETQFGHPAKLAARAPGRVNLLGEHVDYNDGMVLPVAIDRAVQIAAAPSSDGLVTLYALDLGEMAAFPVGEAWAWRERLPSWARYPAGVAWALEEAGLHPGGLQAAFTSDVPMGAGLSSSAAVEVAFATAWRLIGGWSMNCLELARICQRAENAYVGVNCGLMDQFASACGIEGHVLYFDTRSLAYEPLPLPVGMAIVIADSKVRRSLAESAYNARRAACEEAVRLLHQHLPHITSLRDVNSVEFAAYADFLPEETRMRAEHVVKEIARVETAVRALRKQDAVLFGGQMYAGHMSLRRLYEVSCKELDILVDAARHIPGCYGARLTGAGFGGCTVNLVDATYADSFAETLRADYLEQTGLQADVYVCQASQGASAYYLDNLNAPTRD
jgi:galactokinase